MANCPNCGSSHVTIRKETNVSWGRAVAGWALFGVVGGAVGAVTGEDRNANVCLDCGTSWKAVDLYNTLRVIENLTATTLHLGREPDRSYMNSFIAEVVPYIEAVSDVEKKAENLITQAQNSSVESAATGCASGCVFSFIVFFATAGVLASQGLLVLMLVPPLIGYGIGSLVDKTRKKKVGQEVEKAKIEAYKIKHEAEEDLKFILREFTNKHFL